jgi:hypothetical protein
LTYSPHYLKQFKERWGSRRDLRPWENRHLTGPKSDSPRIYEIVEVETENNAEQPGERTHFENPKTRYRQAR